MSKDREVILLQLLKRTVEHLRKEVNTCWTILRQPNEEVLKDKSVLVLSNFSSKLFCVDGCSQ